MQGEIELDNLEVAQFVAKELGKELKYTMHDNPTSRPGHDLRYALDGDKLRELGWKLPLTFFDSLRKTILDDSLGPHVTTEAAKSAVEPRRTMPMLARIPGARKAIERTSIVLGMSAWR